MLNRGASESVVMYRGFKTEVLTRLLIFGDVLIDSLQSNTFQMDSVACRSRSPVSLLVSYSDLRFFVREPPSESNECSIVAEMTPSER